MMPIVRWCWLDYAPHVGVRQVRLWCGSLKWFRDAGDLRHVLSPGVPIPVSGGGDCEAAMTYCVNHRKR